MRAIRFCIIGTLVLTRLAFAQENATEALRAEVEMLRSVATKHALELDQLRVENATLQKQLATQKAAHEATIADLTEQNRKLHASIDLLSQKKGVKMVPMNGDETPLTKVKADPRAYVRKTVFVIGALYVSDEYPPPFGYWVHQETHLSLRLRELRGDASPTGESIHLYLAKKKGSEALVEAIAQAVQKGADCKLARVAVRSEGGNEYVKLIVAELIDWQFLDKDGKSWQAWANGTQK